MSQSSKCDEHHRRLHNAKSLPLLLLLIGDGVKRVHTLACTRAHSLARSHTRTHVCVRPCWWWGGGEKKRKKNKKKGSPCRCPGTYIHRQKSTPLPSHTAFLPGSGSPVLLRSHTPIYAHAYTHAHAHTLILTHTLSSLWSLWSFSLSLTHAPMLQHLLSQRGRRGAKE